MRHVEELRRESRARVLSRPRRAVFVEVVVIVIAVVVVDVVSFNSDGSPNPSSVLERLLT